jgi:hypothetical protein
MPQNLCRDTQGHACSKQVGSRRMPHVVHVDICQTQLGCDEAPDAPKADGLGGHPAFKQHLLGLALGVHTAHQVSRLLAEEENPGGAIFGGGGQDFELVEVDLGRSRTPQSGGP